MSIRSATCTLIFTACVLACGSQSSTDAKGDSTPGGGSTANPVGGGGGGSESGGGGAGASGGASGPPTIVFNEVLAVGTSEWIEVVNPNGEAIDVGGYGVTDSDKDTAEPKVQSAMRFPPGTTIEPGGRVIILTSKGKDDPVGPYAKEECLPEGPETCFYASFGVSQTAGETLYFLAPDGSTISSAAIPAGASADAGAPTNVSQCRLPDVTGDFTSCALTPGQPNRAE